MSNQPTRLDISTPKYPNTYTLIDSDLFAELSQLKWHKDSDGYCINKTRSHLSIHRVIMQAKPGEQVDHINGNKLDNKRSNLRICTNQENSFNRKIRSESTNGYKGIEYRLDKQKWRARIAFNSKKLSIGEYKTKEQAAVAYNIAAKYFFKDFAHLNQISNESEITDQIKQKVEKRLATYNLIF